MGPDHAVLGVWTWFFGTGQTSKDFKQGIDFFFFFVKELFLSSVLKK